jgi:hypothetical protein
MDSKAIDSLQWQTSQLVYRCSFAEIPVFSLNIKGLKTAPNIFEIEEQTPSPAPGTDKPISHAYSLPCSEDLKPGISLKNGYIHHVYTVYKHYFVDTSSSFDDYMGRFKGKTLNSLKRKIKKAEKSNTLKECVEIYKSEEDVQKFLSIAKKISETSYQEKLLGRELPTTAEFNNKLKKMAEAGTFRGYILYAEDTPIAYNLCPIYGDGIMLYDFTGYNPEYSKYSAGTVLQYKIIEQCFEDPNIKTYDLCTGEGQHKEFFATGYKTCCDVFYFPSTLFYIASVYSRFLIENLSRKITHGLEKAGVKNKIKKLIRRFK